MRTLIYIDGFNLYYGSLKGTPYKWLNFDTLFRTLLQPHHEIQGIKYFTAKVSAQPNNPQVHTRQQAYLDAVTKTVPNLEIIYGHFRTNTVSMPLETPINGQRYANVIKTEEKGSDVNLAVHLLNDARLDLYDCAVLVSNDSDLAETLRIVRQQLSKKAILIPPLNIYPQQNKRKKRRPVNALKRWCMTTVFITEAALLQSQMPDSIPGTNISKPKDW